MQICIEEQLPKAPQTVRPRAMSLYQVVQLRFPLQNITQPFVILFMFFLLFNKACSKYRAVPKKKNQSTSKPSDHPQACAPLYVFLDNGKKFTTGGRGFAECFYTRQIALCTRQRLCRV